MANKNLANAKNAKQDEYYTQYHDIEAEMNAYLEYNPDVFKGKTILLPCDDPEWSNFTKFFANNFEQFGIKKLISTSFAPESKKYKGGYQPSLFETEDVKFDKDKTLTHGKIFILDHDRTGDGLINGEDLEWDYLEGDGDFRSKEVTALRDEADIIVTNPPFSMFREFMAWLNEAPKQYILIANKSTVTYKEVFPLIQHNKLWTGKTSMGTDLLFDIPEELAAEFVEKEKEGSKYKIVEGKIMGRSASVWFTNIEHGRRHQPLSLMTKADNLRYSRHKDICGLTDYLHYDNCDAIEVPYTDAIPSDYDGVMGVPISFLDKYCPEQFEIVGITKTWFGFASKQYPPQTQVGKNGKESVVTKLNDGAVIEIPAPIHDTYYVVDGKYYIQKYARILIRKKQ